MLLVPGAHLGGVELSRETPHDTWHPLLHYEAFLLLWPPRKSGLEKLDPAHPLGGKVLHEAAREGQVATLLGPRPRRRTRSFSRRATTEGGKNVPSSQPTVGPMRATTRILSFHVWYRAWAPYHGRRLFSRRLQTNGCCHEWLAERIGHVPGLVLSPAHNKRLPEQQKRLRAAIATAWRRSPVPAWTQPLRLTASPQFTHPPRS